MLKGGTQEPGDQQKLTEWTVGTCGHTVEDPQEITTPGKAPPLEARAQGDQEAAPGPGGLWPAARPISRLLTSEVLPEPHLDEPSKMRISA